MSDPVKEYIRYVMAGREKASDVIIVDGRLYAVDITAMDTDSVKAAIERMMGGEQ